MLKVSRTDCAMNLLEPLTKVSSSLGRNFGYKLSDKKAKSNLLKGAARESLEIFDNKTCVMLFFNVGSYLEVVFPSVLKYDDGGKHIDTLVTFKVNGQKIVVSCYNTTQKIKVDGAGKMEFVQSYLKPLFNDIIVKSGQKIDEYNKSVIATLFGKRKAVSRPVRSVR